MTDPVDHLYLIEHQVWARMDAERMLPWRTIASENDRPQLQMELETLVRGFFKPALLLDYLQSLWAPLVRTARAQGDIDADTERMFPYESFLVRDRSVNAFALPGGYVGVHLGLMAITATRDELASVLAHELSHVTQRHIARGIANSRKQRATRRAGASTTPRR